MKQKFIIDAGLKIVLDERFAPVYNKKTHKISKTYCNLAVYQFCQYLHLPKEIFYNKKKKRIMTANEMYDFAKEKNDCFLDISKLINISFTNVCNYVITHTDRIIFAIIKQNPHGHIAPIFPNEEIKFSAKWNCLVPMVANVGKEQNIMGLNYAFADKPDFFEYKEKI